MATSRFPGIQKRQYKRDRRLKNSETNQVEDIRAASHFFREWAETGRCGLCRARYPLGENIQRRYGENTWKTRPRNSTYPPPQGKANLYKQVSDSPLLRCYLNKQCGRVIKNRVVCKNCCLSNTLGVRIQKKFNLFGKKYIRRTDFPLLNEFRGFSP